MFRKTTRGILTVVLLLSLLLVQVPALACTVFAATDGTAVLAGNNEDWFDKDTFIWFLPAESGKYGRVYYGFENAHPQGGMNDKGLFFDWFAQGGKVSPANPDKLVFSGDLSDNLLETCATVEDALALYEKYNDVNLGYATILLADSTGDMATITWDWQNNQPLVTHQKGSHMVIGVGQPKLAPRLGKEPVDTGTFTGMLEDSCNQNTLYSTVCNLKTGEVTLYHRRYFNDKAVFTLSEELKKGRHLLSIPSLFPEHPLGDADELTPWKIRGPVLSGICIGVAALIALSIVLYALLWILKKPKGFAMALPAAGIASNAALLGLLVFLNDKLFFASKYGIGLYGAGAACAFWATAALGAALAAATVLSWIKKQHNPAIRIAASASSVITLAALLYLMTLGVFIQ